MYVHIYVLLCVCWFVCVCFKFHKYDAKLTQILEMIIINRTETVIKNTHNFLLK